MTNHYFQRKLGGDFVIGEFGVASANGKHPRGLALVDDLGWRPKAGAVRLHLSRARVCVIKAGGRRRRGVQRKGGATLHHPSVAAIQLLNHVLPQIVRLTVYYMNTSTHPYLRKG